jgi:hypothetical protein
MFGLFKDEFWQVWRDRLIWWGRLAEASVGHRGAMTLPYLLKL